MLHETICLAAAGSFELKSRATRKRVFLAEMQQIVPWSELKAIITASVTLRIHFLQQRFGLSDPAMEEALYDVPLYPGVCRP